MQSRMGLAHAELALPTSTAQKQYSTPRSYKVSPLIILLLLITAALIPRLLLAGRLDMVTDEFIYILSGKVYMPLLRHLPTYLNSADWLYNNEHPPFVKLLIGLIVTFNALLGHPFDELFVARLPSVFFGTLLVVGVYLLGRAPLGRTAALLAALCLAFSPWFVYFSALAYLDIPMTACATLACLLAWHAQQKPRLYLLIALLLGIAIDSKYTAALAIPGIVLFTLYCVLFIRPRLSQEQCSALPWRYWSAALMLLPLTFLALDPAIWPAPLSRLWQSILFDWQHSVQGHPTFLAGSYAEHVPHWSILYILFVKLSAFVTLPALGFVVFALVRLGCFSLSTMIRTGHTPRRVKALRPPVRWGSPEASIVQTERGRPQGSCSLHPTRSNSTVQELQQAFLLLWLLPTVGMFSLLNIVVGTHYELPAAVPVVLAGAYSMVRIERLVWQNRWIWRTKVNVDEMDFMNDGPYEGAQARSRGKGRENRTIFEEKETSSTESIIYGVRGVGVRRGWPSAFVRLCLLTILFVGPHLLGLSTTYAAEGYSSEFFRGENASLQVAYPGYREALQWLATSEHRQVQVELVALLQTLRISDHGVSWYAYNSDLVHRFRLTAVTPEQREYSANYLIWPMHLIQRGFLPPQAWREHIIHQVIGGETVYCYVLAKEARGVG